jgi:ABC-type phosphate transport system substrate-binding protein
VRALRTVTILVVFLAASGGRSGVVNAEGWTTFRVIVNPDNPTVAVDRQFLADAFLKKVTRWPNDDLIRPVDQEPGATARHTFSDGVLKRSVAAVKSYWQQMIFSGNGVPPPELDNEGEVVRFVLKNRGAVGYVSAGINLQGAKILTVR